MVATLVLETSAFGCVGSNPTIGTKLCVYGGTGRHAVLRRLSHRGTGSTPVRRTNALVVQWREQGTSNPPI